MSSSRIIGAATALAAAGAIATGAVAAAGSSGSAADKKITPSGVGQVKLGKTHQSLRADGLVGPIRPGCELSGPDVRSAKLRAPLKGSVDYTLTAPRKVRRITVTGGAKARGVGIGGTIAQIKAAFPKAKVDHSTEDVFGITLVKIPKDGGGRLRFAVDVGSKKITMIGIPVIPFCD
jgi:hypothetical protein